MAKISLFYPVLAEKPTDEEVAAAEKVIAARDAAIEDRKKNAGILCPKCNKFLKISEQTYIQTHWYTSPRGCNEGDYWNSGEGQTECGCGYKFRFYKSMDNSEEVVSLKRYFNKVVDVYNDR